MYKEEFLKELGFEDNEHLKTEAQKIKVDGYKLSQEEKISLLLSAKMEKADLTQEYLEKHLLWERQLNKTIKKQEQTYQRFINHLNKIANDNIESIWHLGAERVEVIDEYIYCFDTLRQAAKAYYETYY